MKSRDQKQTQSPVFVLILQKAKLKKYFFSVRIIQQEQMNRNENIFLNT